MTCSATGSAGRATARAGPRNSSTATALSTMRRRDDAGRTRDFTAKVKAAGVADGLAEGQFVAIVSVFGNEDSMGDIVRPGAFTSTLQDWADSGDPIPVIWSHDWDAPFAHIGTV